MTEGCDKNLSNLLIKHFPSEDFSLDLTRDLKYLYIVRQKSRLRVLDELQIHADSVKQNNIQVFGFYALINNLDKLFCETISILCARNKEHSFEIYLTDDCSKRIGYSLVKNREKSESELLWELSLGINHDS